MRRRNLGGRARRIGALGLLLAGVALAGNVRLYDLKTGTVSNLKYKNTWHRGHGGIKGTLASGVPVEGEFATVAPGASGWGSIYGSRGYSSGGIVAMGAQQPGTAIITGAGIVIQCEYVVSAFNGHGSGSCRDNSDNQYSLMF